MGWCLVDEAHAVVYVCLDNEYAKFLINDNVVVHSCNKYKTIAVILQ